MKKPTASDIKELEENLRSYYGIMHSRFDECDRAYDGQISVKVFEGYDKYVPPTAKARVDTAVDHNITTNPVVTVPPAKKTMKNQNMADILEKYYHMMLWWNATIAPSPPPREAAKHMLLYGMCCLKGPLFDKNYDSENAWRRRFPFVYRAINPKTVLPEPSFFWRGDGAVLEVSKRKVGDVQQFYRFKTDKKPFDDVTWREYWSLKWRGYMVDDEFVMGPIHNDYEMVPYEFGFSGMGRITEKPEDLAVGLIYPNLSAFSLEARVKSAVDAIIQTHAYQRLTADFDPSLIKWGKGPGQITQIPKEGVIRPLFESRVPGDLFNFMNMLAEDIQQGTFADALMGTVAKGVNTAYFQNTNIGQARMRVQQVIRTLEAKLSIVLGKTAYLTEKLIAEPISIWGQTGKGAFEESFDPDDIGGHYVCYVSLETMPPEEEDRRSLTGQQLYQGGTMSLQRVMEKYHRIQDTSGEFEQIMIEKALLQPAILEALQNGALAKWGMAEFVKQVSDIQKKMMAEQKKGIPELQTNPQGEPIMPPQAGTFAEMDLANRQSMMTGVPGAVGGQIAEPPPEAAFAR